MTANCDTRSNVRRGTPSPSNSYTLLRTEFEELKDVRVNNDSSTDYDDDNVDPQYMRKGTAADASLCRLNDLLCLRAGPGGPGGVRAVIASAATETTVASP
jgi:hypothetical protein